MTLQVEPSAEVEVGPASPRCSLPNPVCSLPEAQWQWDRLLSGGYAACAACYAECLNLNYLVELTSLAEKLVHTSKAPGDLAEAAIAAFIKKISSFPVFFGKEVHGTRRVTNVRGWLRNALQYAVRNADRPRASDPRLSVDDGPPPPAPAADPLAQLIEQEAAEATGNAFYALIGQLSARERAVVLLRFIGDMTLNQIADGLRTPYQTLWRNMRSGMATLEAGVPGLGAAGVAVPELHGLLWDYGSESGEDARPGEGWLALERLDSRPRAIVLLRFVFEFSKDDTQAAFGELTVGEVHEAVAAFSEACKKVSNEQRKHQS